MIIAVDGPDRLGQRHDRQGARRAFRPAAPRHRTALPRGRAAMLPRRRRSRRSRRRARRGELPRWPAADPELRSEATGGLASRVSVHPLVRQALFERQRSFATQPGGAVLDGRDIGTVIAPDAEVKLFVTASVEARAQRRWKEMQGRGDRRDPRRDRSRPRRARRARPHPRRSAAARGRRRGRARHLGAFTRTRRSPRRSRWCAERVTV